MYLTRRGRTFVLGVFAIVPVAFIFSILLSQLATTKIEIEPIAVSDTLAGAGQKPDVISAKLIEHIRKIEKTAATTMNIRGVSLAGEQPDISIPGAGISIAAVVSYLRPLLNDRAAHISGEITEAGRDVFRFRVTLRLNGIFLYGSQRYVGVSELDDELKAAAEQVVHGTEAYVYASYLYPEHTEDAKKVINDIIDRPAPDEDTVRAYNLRGLILHDEGRRDAAILAYETSIFLAKKYGIANFAAPHINLGNTLFESGRVKDVRLAIVHYQKAIELQPDSADARMRLGDALLETRRVDEAIDSYLIAAKLDDQNSYIFRGIAKALRSSAAQRDGRYDIAARLLAEWDVAHGQFDEAIEIYKKALTKAPSATAVVTPKLADAYYKKGQKLMDEDRHEACIAFRNALAIMRAEVAYRAAVRDWRPGQALQGGRPATQRCPQPLPEGPGIGVAGSHGAPEGRRAPYP